MGRLRDLRNLKTAFMKKNLTVIFYTLIALDATLALYYFLLKNEPVITNLFDRNQAYLISPNDASQNTKAAKLIQEQVTPSNGLKTPIILGDIIPKMVSLGIIDIKKIEDQYKQKGGIPQEEKDLLIKPSKSPLVITSKNQFWLVTLLWPLGLSNKMDINKESPVAGKDVNHFASTRGWTLGQEENGGNYFNKYPLIPLTPQQEQRVRRLAESIYRPCCNNSTFFQDCNHGSAALGLIELGVSQGLNDQEIYKTILSFNSFWFPQNYTEIAFYLQSAKNTNWSDVDPKLVLSKTYSSISGWQLINASVSKIPGLIPQTKGGGSCGA